MKYTGSLARGAARELNGTPGSFEPPILQQAAADHLVLSHYRTFGLPVLSGAPATTTAPYQYPEKSCPFVIFTHGARGRPLPLYGNGGNIREW